MYNICNICTIHPRSCLRYTYKWRSKYIKHADRYYLNKQKGGGYKISNVTWSGISLTLSDLFSTPIYNFVVYNRPQINYLALIAITCVMSVMVSTFYIHFIRGNPIAKLLLQKFCDLKAKNDIFSAFMENKRKKYKVLKKIKLQL